MVDHDLGRHIYIHSIVLINPFGNRDKNELKIQLILTSKGRSKHYKLRHKISKFLFNKVKLNKNRI